MFTTSCVAGRLAKISYPSDGRRLGRSTLALNESGEGARIYLLRVESRELRNQAQKLWKQRADSMTRELGNGSTRKPSFSSGAVQQRDRRDHG
jgi:hypothetical protein